MSAPEARTILLHAITPVHAGTGQAVSVVDLPTARERATGWPFIPGSTVRGVLRDEVKAVKGEAWVKDVFGPEPSERIEAAGKIHMTDQLILLFPARSFFGTFAFLTCPLALHRMVRDHTVLGITSPLTCDIPEPAEAEALVPGGSVLSRGDKAFFEDLDISASHSRQAEAIATGLGNLLFSQQEKDTFVKRFALVSDSVFDFLCETATEVSARIRLDDEKKTVDRGALWYEESVPAEAVFHGFLMVAQHARNAARDIVDAFDNLQGKAVQIGGSAGTGRGLCRVIVGGV